MPHLFSDMLHRVDQGAANCAACCRCTDCGQVFMGNDRKSVQVQTKQNSNTETQTVEVVDNFSVCNLDTPQTHCIRCLWEEY